MIDNFKQYPTPQCGSVVPTPKSSFQARPCAIQFTQSTFCSVHPFENFLGVVMRLSDFCMIWIRKDTIVQVLRVALIMSPSPPPSSPIIHAKLALLACKCNIHLQQLCPTQMSHLYKNYVTILIRAAHWLTY